MRLPGGYFVTEDKKAWRPRTAIPKSLKTFGRVPDFDVWHPGDLILTRDKKPNAISEAIRKVQEPGYGAEYAK